MTRLFDQLDSLPDAAEVPGLGSGHATAEVPCWHCRQQVPKPGEHLNPATGDYICRPG